MRRRNKPFSKIPRIATTSSSKAISQDFSSAIQILQENAAQESIPLPENAPRAFEIYLRELYHWNQKFNLTAITSPKDIVIKHFLDSLLVTKITSLEPSKLLIDIGSGAGFPGVPLKIVQPSLRVTLVDSQLKRVRFLKHLVHRLELKDIQVIHARAEELGQNPAHREQYDYATARAVADLPVLLEYTLPLVKVGGLFIALKGPKGEQELASASYALEELRGALERKWEGILPGGEKRILYLFRKVASTPPRYPRKPGEPLKNPLKRLQE